VRSATEPTPSCWTCSPPRRRTGRALPEQKITVKVSIEAYTLGSAYAGFEEQDRGFISRGKLADFAVLSRDILDPKEIDKIADTHVVLTVVGGKIVFEK
jgi:predicted amidohydrolase YtcJ